jgi:hypothetical protein
MLLITPSKAYIKNALSLVLLLLYVSSKGSLTLISLFGIVINVVKVLIHFILLPNTKGVRLLVLGAIMS